MARCEIEPAPMDAKLSLDLPPSKVASCPGSVAASLLPVTSTDGCDTAMVTSSRSFAVSKGIFLYSSEFTPSGPAMLTPIVWPSGAALATASVPMLPAAPLLFSTMKGWPSLAARRSPITRATRSGVEPASNGTTTFTGPCGHSCERAGPTQRQAVAMSRVRRRSVMGRVS